MTDLTHISGRVPDGQGHPAEADRRHEADVFATRCEVAARVYWISWRAAMRAGPPGFSTGLSTARASPWIRGG
jgi:hypothetical protein